MCPSSSNPRTSSRSSSVPSPPPSPQSPLPKAPSSDPSSTMSNNVQEESAPSKNNDAVRQAEDSPPPLTPLYAPNRVVSKEQLEVLNFLVHPVWVFDIDHRRMNWANQAAVELWNASSLPDLLGRNFSDMTDASITRLKTYQAKFNQGQRVTDQWTFYPKQEAKTVDVVCSGIRLSMQEANPSMLVEGLPVHTEKLHPETLRGVEMLRHLPVPVCQFDMNGEVMFQNPEGTLIQAQDTESIDEGDESQEGTASSSSKLQKASSNCDNLVSRFVDEKLGLETLQKMQDGKIGDSANDKKIGETTLKLHASIRTRNGPRWSEIQLRKTSDPVTGKPVILYSSRDLTDAVQAQKERENSVKKSEFLAIMAHEIRTPLHQVTGFIDLLDQTELDPEQRSFVKLLKSSAQGLMIVINDVLDYSKLEAGKMKLESIPFEPRSVLEGTMAAVQAGCEEQGLYLKMDWDKDIPFKVMGDPNRVRQVLLNLLSNAIKFTKQGGIAVRASAVKSSPPITSKSTQEDTCRPMIKFVVTDTGQGITEEHKHLIFTKYHQGSASVARTYGGTGLGLSICQLLVQDMGGSIGVESILGKGSSFWFTLPAEEPNDGDCAENELDPSFRDDVSPLHILVAEDNKVNQKLVSSMLKRMGHTSDMAVNGKNAIEMLEQNKSPNRYDVVLMDIQMPVMDGLEATRRIRSMGYTNLPIFGLTASVAHSDFAELGFDDWLAKPIAMKDLKTKLYRIQTHLLTLDSNSYSSQ